VIVIQNPSSGGLIDAIVLWHGVASALPADWLIYAPAKDAYILGATPDDIVETPIGENTHLHTNPTTNAVANHTHTAEVGTQSGASSIVEIGPAGGGSSIASEHTHSSWLASTGSGGNHLHTLLDTNAVMSLPPSKRLYWIRRISGSTIPNGVIVMTTLPAAQIPAGWNICDGLGGRIDLRGQFIVGANLDSDVGQSAGAANHQHSNSKTASGGGHTHSYGGSLSNATATANQGFSTGVHSVAAGNHTHSTSGQTSSSGAHDHDVVDTNAAAYEPPFALVYFIQKG
jgi:hypothetical protein